MNIKAYARLMRLDKPIGTILLWCPTAWALWLANQGVPSVMLFVYFVLGTFLMRSAGCVVNDIADRHIDRYVHRTINRPLTQGEIHLFEALGVLLVLLILSFIILMQLPWACFPYAVFALIVTCVYPFCKRFFSAPQVVLGVAFSMSIPMVYVASGMLLNTTMVFLFIMNLAWIVAYDTMYAMVDREDDLKIRVHSTAILFGRFDVTIIAVLLLFMHIAWMVIALQHNYGLHFYVFWLLAFIVLLYQLSLVRRRQPAQCFRAFKVNAVYGLLMWLALI